MGIRSKPLKIDKATGEPKELLPVQINHEPWKLVVLDRKKHTRKVKKYWSYKEAKEAVARLEEKYGDRIEAHVVSRQIGYGPPYSKVTDYQIIRQNQRRRYWCPYCRKFRRFLHLPSAGCRACEFCHTRETDFHVIKCNPIFWHERE